jgi:hypothetical protein
VTSALQGDAVAPRVVRAGVPGEAVLRGQGLASLTGVSFGGNDATSITQVSDTEVHAAYPALTAGAYAVQPQNASGPVPFSGTLVVIDPPGFAATTLGYPSSPGNFRSIVFDAARQAILVATDTQILRYAFVDPAWQAPLQLAIPDLRDIALSNDGASLLALATHSLRQLDPVTLVQGGITSGPVSGPSSPVPLNRLALANNGVAVVGAEQFETYFYLSGNPGFFRAVPNGTLFAFGALPAAGENRSLIAVIQGQLSPAPPALTYLASSGSFSASSVNLNRVSVNLSSLDPLPAVDRSGLRISFHSSVGTFSGINVFDNNLTQLGALPATTAAVAFAPNPSGPAVRAYTLDAGMLRAFDLAAPPVGGSFVEITSQPYPMTLSSGPGNHPRMLITPDGGTAILAGDARVVIVPTP